MEETYVPQNSKRRSSKACLRCRARKVRCDVIDGLPCTNCRLDRVECTVAASLRRRKLRAGDTYGRRRTTSDTLVGGDISPRYTNFDNPTATTNLNVTVPNAPGQFPPPQISPYCREQRSEGTANATATSPGYNRDRTFLTGSESPLEHPQLQPNVDSRRSHPVNRSADAGNGLHNGLPLSPPSQTSTDLRLGSVGGSEIAFPKYIRRTSAYLEADDVERLRTKGAFILPDTALRNELLRCYVQYVHPYLPVVELEDFLAAVEKDEATKTVSLLLFQAVMFAATPYVASRTLAAHGYSDRRKARRCFYLRVKLLCDMDYELDRLTVIQSTLLMTYWNETPDDPKDVWYWLGVAVSLSKRIGLNYELSPSPPRNLLERRLWKRLWWSCYTRDRLVSLAFRRPARIRQDEFDQPMLELSDLETKPLSGEVSEMLGGQCPTFQNEALRVSLAKLCIGMAELCVCLTPILEMQYRKSNRGAVAQVTKMGGSTDEIISNASNLLQCDHSLKRWYQTYAANLHCFNGMPSDHSWENGGQVSEIHKAVLKGLYLTSISILHRPQILSSAINSALDSEIRDLSRRKTHEAADELTILYTNLYARGLIRFLPNSGITCLLHAAITHVLDQTVGDKDLQQSARRKFGLCTQALEQMGENYASAAFAFSFLTTAANKLSSRLETTEASIRLGESMLGVKHNNEKSLSHFGCQFNVPPPGSLQPGSRSTVISAANSEPSRAPSRMDVRETAQRPGDTSPTISNQTMQRQYQVGVDHGYNTMADGTGDSHNNINPNTGAVRGNGRTGDETQHDFDCFLDMEGSADFFNLSDELGVSFDTQWFDTLGP